MDISALTRVEISIPDGINFDSLELELDDDGSVSFDIETLEAVALESGIDVFYDESGSIGRRYARADEIGIFHSITIDYESLENDTVTVRERDSTEQKRISVSSLKDLF